MVVQNSSLDMNDKCYRYDEVLKTGFMIAVILLLITLILIQFSSSVSDCYSGFWDPPEESVLGGMGALPTISVPPLDSSKVIQSMAASSFSNDNDGKKKKPKHGKGGVSEFNNDLANQLTTKIPDDNTNYADVAANMALEPSIIQGHNEYAKQREKYTGTASFNPERSDSQDIVPFVGLRRTSYLTSKGDSLVDPTARQVPSVIDPATLSKPVDLTWSYNKF